MAWAMDPIHDKLKINHHSAKARAKAASSWFAGGPTVSGDYMDDHVIGSNEGYTTYQGGISVPLWLPGQGRSTRAVADAEALSLDEEINVEHLFVSVRVLDAILKENISYHRVMIAKENCEIIRKIYSEVENGKNNGEVPETDLLMAKSAYEVAENELNSSEEEYSYSKYEINEIIGKELHVEISGYDNSYVSKLPFNSEKDIENRDPRIKLSIKNVNLAEENLKLERRSFMPNPEVGIDVIHEKQYGSPWDDRVGIHFSIPLPSAVRNVPLRSEASNRLAKATSEEIKTRRMVHVEIMKIREHLISSESSYKYMRSAEKDIGDRIIHQEKAWREGEVSLKSLLMSIEEYNKIKLLSMKYEFEWHAACIRILIERGKIP